MIHHFLYTSHAALPALFVVEKNTPGSSTSQAGSLIIRILLEILIYVNVFLRYRPQVILCLDKLSLIHGAIQTLGTIIVRVAVFIDLRNKRHDTVRSFGSSH